MASPVPFQKIQTSNKDVNQLQINVANAIQPLGNQLNQASASIASNPVNGGLIISSQLSKTPVKIPQQLGSIPTGWILCDVNQAVIIHRTAWDVNSITLVATSACTASILVF